MGVAAGHRRKPSGCPAPFCLQCLDSALHGFDIATVPANEDDAGEVLGRPAQLHDNGFECVLTDRQRSREVSVLTGRPVWEWRGDEHLDSVAIVQHVGCSIGECVSDARVGVEWEVGAVLLCAAERHEEQRPATRKDGADCDAEVVVHVGAAQQVPGLPCAGAFDTGCEYSSALHPRARIYMADAWFETVAEAQRRAKKRLPAPVYGALMAGSEAGVSRDGNLDAFAQLGFAPEVANKPAERDLATTVMGQPISLPALISPTGVQAVHPDGEVAVARAAAARGTAMGLSSFASKPLEEVIEANPQTFFQIYWCGTREHMAQRLGRAREAGAVGLIVTLDWSFSHGRDWGSPFIPERIDSEAVKRYAIPVARRPRWLLDWARTKKLPDLSVPNMAVDGNPPPTFFQAYGEWMGTPPATWDDLKWLRSEWDGPLMIKGIIRVDDALRARDLGATCISVSNHGGNNLDTTPAPIRALAAVKAAIGDDMEIVLDGGVRRGSDVVKAVALGARATMLGRAYLWGLAANGQAGVENVLDIIRNGIDAVLLGLSKPSIGDLVPSDIVVPDGFPVALGEPT